MLNPTAKTQFLFTNASGKPEARRLIGRMIHALLIPCRSSANGE